MDRHGSLPPSYDFTNKMTSIRSAGKSPSPFTAQMKCNTTSRDYSNNNNYNNNNTTNNNLNNRSNSSKSLNYSYNRNLGPPVLDEFSLHSPGYPNVQSSGSSSSLSSPAQQQQQQLSQHQQHQQQQNHRQQQQRQQQSLSFEQRQRIQRRVQKCIQWMDAREREMESACYGRDLRTCREAFDRQKHVHLSIKQFQEEIQQCVDEKVNMPSDDIQSYNQQLSELELLYTKLLSTSNFRLANLQTMEKFLDSSCRELDWMKEREASLSDYIQSMDSINDDISHFSALSEELADKREMVVRLIAKGHDLIKDNHPASNSIQLTNNFLQVQWDWLTQLANCLQVHISNICEYKQFKDGVDNVGGWVDRQTRLLNDLMSRNITSSSDISKAANALKELNNSISQHEMTLQNYLIKSSNIPTVKIKSQTLPPNTNLMAVCSYKLSNISIEKGDKCILLNDSLAPKWKVKTCDGIEGILPSACFVVVGTNSAAQQYVLRIQNKLNQLSQQLSTYNATLVEQMNKPSAASIVLNDMNRSLTDVDVLESKLFAFSNETVPFHEESIKKFDEKLIEMKTLELDPVEKKIANIKSDFVSISPSQISPSMQDIYSSLMNKFKSVKDLHYNLLQRNSSIRSLVTKRKEIFEGFQQTPANPNQISIIEKLLGSFEREISSFKSFLPAGLSTSSQEVLHRELLKMKSKLISLKSQSKYNKSEFNVPTSPPNVAERNRNFNYTEKIDVLEKHDDYKMGLSAGSSIVNSCDKSDFSKTKLQSEERSNNLQQVESYNNQHQLINMPQEEHMQSEDAEEFTQPIKDGEEKITKKKKVQYYSRKTDTEFESVSTHEKKLISLSTTKASAYSGKIQFPLSIFMAYKYQLLDLETGHFIHPDTNDVISLKDAINTNLLDVDDASFVCPSSKKIYTLYDAFKLKLLNSDGTFHGLEGDIGLKELVTKKYITLKSNVKKLDKAETSFADEDDEMYFESLQTVETLTKKNLFAIISVIDPETKRKIDAFTAVQRGILDQANAIYNAKDYSGTVIPIPIQTAVDMNLIFVDDDFIPDENIDNKLVYETKTYTITGVVDPVSRRKISLDEAVNSGYVDQIKGTFYNIVSQKTIPIIEAISLGFVLAEVSSSIGDIDVHSSSKILTSKEVAFTVDTVLNAANGKQISVLDAVKIGIFDPIKGEYVNMETGKVFTLNEAVDEGWIKIIQGKPKEQEEEVLTREEKVPSLHIDDEMDAREEMAREEIIEERRTFQITGVKDHRTDEFISFQDAVHIGLLDENKGLYYNSLTGKRMTIPEALEKGLIIGTMQTVDHQELFKSDVVAQKKNDITAVYNPITKILVSLNEALQLGLLNSDLSLYFNPASNKTLTIDDAVARGLIRVKSTVRRNDLRLLSSSGVDESVVTSKTKIHIDWSGGNVINVATKQRIPITEALKHGLIEESVAHVLRLKNPDKEVSVKEKKKSDDPPLLSMVVQMSFVRDQSGRVIIKDESSTMKEQLAEKRITGELMNSKIGISFKDAISLGLYNIQKGSYFDPHTKKLFNLNDAIAYGLINLKLPCLFDLFTGTGLTLNEALKSGCIDLVSGKLVADKLAPLNITLDPVYFTMQHVVLNIEDAIRSGLFSDESGLFQIPFTDKQIDLETALKAGFISGNANVVLNPINGERVYFDQAVKTAVINGKTGKFVDSSIDKNITLSRAIVLGLIKHTYLNKCSIIMEKESGDLFALEDAIDGNYVDCLSSSVYDPLLRKRVSLKMAINSGLIENRSKVYLNRLDNSETPLSVAAKLGIINFPGAPVLANPKTTSNDIIQTQLHTNVSLTKGAKLHQKIVESLDVKELPPFELKPKSGTGLKKLSDNPVEVNFVKNEPNKKTSETKTFDTNTDETPLKFEIEKDGNLLSTQRTVVKTQKSLAKESVENVMNDFNFFHLHDSLSDKPTQQLLPGIEQVSDIKTYKETAFFSPKYPVNRTNRFVSEVTVKDSVLPHNEIDFEPNELNFDQLTKPKAETPSLEINQSVLKKDLVTESIDVKSVHINWELGLVVDTLRNITMSAEEAYRKGLIDIHVKELIEQSLVNKIISKNQKLTLNEALESGLIIIPLSKVKNPLTNQTLTLEDSIKTGFIDLNRSIVIDPAINKPCSLNELVNAKIFNVENAVMKNKQANKLLTLSELVMQGLIPEHGLPQAGKTSKVNEMIKKGYLNPALNAFKEPTTGYVIKSDTAKAIGYIEDDEDGSEIDEETEVEHNLSRDYKKPTVNKLREPVPLIEAIRNGFINPLTLFFTHPYSGETFTFKEAVDRGFILVPKIENIVDRVDGVCFEVAFKEGYIDIKNNTFTDPITDVLMPLDAAIRKGYIILPLGGLRLKITELDSEVTSTNETSVQFTKFLEFKDLPLKYEEAVLCSLYDEINDRFTNPYNGDLCTIEDAMKKGLIDSKSKVMNPLTGTLISLQQAVSNGFVDSENGKFIDPKTGEFISLDEALDLNLIKPRGTYVWIGMPFVEYLKIASNCRVFDHFSKQYVSLQEAVDHGIVNLSRDLYYDSSKQLSHSLEEAAQKNFVLFDQPVIQNNQSSSDTLNFKILKVLDSSRNLWISPSEALKQNILNMKDSLYFDFSNNDYINFHDAMDQNKIIVELLSGSSDAVPSDKVFLIKSVLNLKTKRWENPIEAEKNKLIDMDNETYLNVLNNLKSSLYEAMLAGFIDAEEINDLEKLLKENLKVDEIREILDYTTGDKLTVEEAVERNLIDKTRSSYIDPRNGDHLTLYEAWQLGYILLKSDSWRGFKSKMIKSVIDPRSGEEIPISDAVRHQIVDKVGGKYWNMKTNTYMDLDFAISKGFVLIESVDKAVKKQALVEIEDNLKSNAQVFVINSVKSPSTEEEFDAIEAERRGFLNKIQGIYMNPLTGEQISIKEAMDRNFINASIVDDPDYDALQDNEAAYAILQTGDLFSEISSVLDTTTGEKISVFEGIRRGLLDLKTNSYIDRETGRIISIQEAVREKLVMQSDSKSKTQQKSNKLYYFKVKVSSNFLVSQTNLTTSNSNIAEMTLKQAVSMGFVDQGKGLFYDPTTNEVIPILTALQSGRLIADSSAKFNNEMKTSSRSSEKITTINLPSNFSNSFENFSTKQHSEIKTGESNLQPHFARINKSNSQSFSSKSQGTENFSDDQLTNVTYKTSIKVPVFTKTSSYSDVVTTSRPTSRSEIESLDQLLLELEQGGARKQVDLKCRDDNFNKHSLNDINVKLRSSPTGVVAIKDVNVDVNLNGDIQNSRNSSSDVPTMKDDMNKVSANNIVEELIQPTIVDRNMTTEKITTISNMKDWNYSFSDDDDDVDITEELVIAENVNDLIEPSKEEKTFACTVASIANTQLNETFGAAPSTRSPLLSESAKTSVYALDELVELKLYNADEGMVFYPELNKHFTLLEAIEKGIVTKNSVKLCDPVTNKLITLVEAFERGKMDPDNGNIIDDHGGKIIKFHESIKQALQLQNKIPQSVEVKELNRKKIDQVNLCDALFADYLDVKSRLFNIPGLGKPLSLKDCLKQEYITTDSVMYRDSETTQKVPLDVLLTMNLVDLERAQIRDNKGNTIAIEVAFKEKVLYKIANVKGAFPLMYLLEEGFYNPSNNKFFDLASKQYVSLGEAIDKNILDHRSVLCIDSNEVLGLKDALKSGWINPSTGFTKSSLSIIDAFDRGDLLIKPISLTKAVDLNLMNESTGKFLDPSCRKFFTLEQALKEGIINPDSTIINPSTRKPILLSQAILNGVVDGKNGTVYNLLTREIISIKEALSAAKLLKQASISPQYSLQDCVNKKLIDEKNYFLDPITKNKLSLKDAISNGFIDSCCLLVNPQDGKNITLLDALKHNLVDSIISIMKKSLNQPSAKTSSNTNVSTKFIYKTSSNSFWNAITAENLSFSQALDRKLIDPESCLLKIPGIKRTFTLNEALKLKLFDPMSGLAKDPESGKTFPFSDIILNKDIVELEVGNYSLAEAFDLELVDLETGILINPNDGAKMSLLQAIESNLISYEKSALVVNGNRFNLLQAIENGYIDSKNADLIDAETGKKISTFVDAVQSGHIFDVYIPLKYSLKQLEDAKLFDKNNNCFIHPVYGTAINLEEALNIDLIDSDKCFVCFPKSNERSNEVRCNEGLTLTQAASLNLVSKDLSTILNPVTKENVNLFSVLVSSPESNISRTTITDEQAIKRVTSMLAKQPINKSGVVDMLVQKLQAYKDWMIDVNQQLGLCFIKDDKNFLAEQIQRIQKFNKTVNEAKAGLVALQNDVDDVINQNTMKDVTSSLDLKILKLKQTRDDTKQHFNNLLKISESKLKSLTSCLEELTKYDEERLKFDQWLQSANETFDSNFLLLKSVDNIPQQKEALKNFVDDVMIRQGDLKYVEICRNQFLDQARHFQALQLEGSPGLVSLKRSSAHLDILTSAIDEMQSLTADYTKLRGRSGSLLDKMEAASDCLKRFQDLNAKIDSWLSVTEANIQAMNIIHHNDSDVDDFTVQNNIKKINEISPEVTLQQRLYVKMTSLGNDLIDWLKQIGLLDDIMTNIKENITSMGDRFQQVEQNLKDSFSRFQLASRNNKSKDVAKDIDQLATWVGSVEKLMSELDNQQKFKNYDKFEAINDNEDELMMHRLQHIQTLKNEIISLEPAVSSMIEMTNSDQSFDASIGGRLQQIQSRYRQVIDDCKKKERDLELIVSSSTQLNDDINTLKKWMTNVIDCFDTGENYNDLQSLKLLEKEIQEKQKLVNDIASRMNETALNTLVNKSKFESTINDVQLTLDEIELLRSTKLQQESNRINNDKKFQQLKDFVSRWIRENEEVGASFVDVDEFVEQQKLMDYIDLLESMHHSHLEFKGQMEEFNEVACIVDENNMQVDKTSALQRRLKRYIKKGIRSSSPLTISSTESADEAPSDIDRILVELNNRYDIVGDVIHKSLNNAKKRYAAIQDFKTELDLLDKWVCESKNTVDRFRLKSLLTNKEDDFKYEQMKSLMSDKELDMRSLKLKKEKLFKRLSNNDGNVDGESVPALKSFHKLEVDYLNLQNKMAALEQLTRGSAERMEIFKSMCNQLNSWMSIKMKVLDVSSNHRVQRDDGSYNEDGKEDDDEDVLTIEDFQKPEVLQLQLRQINLLKDELDMERLKYDIFVEKGQMLLGQCDPDTPCWSEINKKLNDIHMKWQHLESKIAENIENLKLLLRQQSGRRTKSSTKSTSTDATAKTGASTSEATTMTTSFIKATTDATMQTTTESTSSFQPPTTSPLLSIATASLDMKPSSSPSSSVSRLSPSTLSPPSQSTTSAGTSESGHAHNRLNGNTNLFEADTDDDDIVVKANANKIDGVDLQKKDEVVEEEMMMMMGEVNNAWLKLCGATSSKYLQQSFKTLSEEEQSDPQTYDTGHIIHAMTTWIDDEYDNMMKEENKYHGDYNYVKQLVDQNSNFTTNVRNLNANLFALHYELNEKISKNGACNDGYDDDIGEIMKLNNNVKLLINKFDTLEKLCNEKHTELAGALVKAHEFNELAEDMVDWLDNISGKLISLSEDDDDEDDNGDEENDDDEEKITKKIMEHEEVVESEIEKQLEKYEKCLRLGNYIQQNAGDDVQQSFADWITLFQERWQDVISQSEQRKSQLISLLDDARSSSHQLEQLYQWLLETENKLIADNSQPIAESLPVVEQLFQDFELLEMEMNMRQEDFDRLTKNMKQQTVKRNKSSSEPPTNQTSEQQFKSKTVQKMALFDKWRHVWLMVMDRRRKLQDVIDNLNEVEEMKNFNPDEWMEEFLSWMNRNTSKILTSFRKYDRNITNHVSRKDFVDAILKTGMPTSYLKVESVADLLEKNEQINYKEFVNCLKNEEMERQAGMSMDERMDDEMDRQFNRCCCDKRFLINKVDEGKYKFGESQKLHLVRIQRSCVMVRVGGGWMALDEFLTKHDPCRLRKLKCASKSTGHIFKSPEGISQTMAPFRSKQAQMSSPARTPIKCRQHNRDDEDKLLEEKSSSYADEAAKKTSEVKRSSNSRSYDNLLDESHQALSTQLNPNLSTNQTILFDV